MDWADCDEIAGVLRGLVFGLTGWLTERDRVLITGFIGVGEVGLALGQIAGVLSDYEQPLAADERSSMLVPVKRMRMGTRVPVALGTCPDR